ncbi:MAG: amidohydrolase [Maribacter sp.]|nr:amidohydrolase [Maribacter sp.]
MEHELRLALLQSPLVWENPERNRKHFSEKFAAISKEVDIIVLPEMFTTGFTMHPENIDPSEGESTIDWMRRKAHNSNAAVVGSIVFHQKGTHTNRLLFVEPNGKIWHYDKRHTFTLAGEDKVYRAGSDKLIVAYKGFKICPMICYDLRFPVWARNSENYDALLFVANWPQPRIMAWDILLKARAIENMAYCIGVNRIGRDESGHQYPGHSAIYDALGKTLVYSEKEEILYATLSKNHLTTTRDHLKFLEDRDTFNLLP